MDVLQLHGGKFCSVGIGILAFMEGHVLRQLRNEFCTTKKQVLQGRLTMSLA